MLRGVSLSAARSVSALTSAASHLTTSKRSLSSEEFAATGPMILVHAKLRTTKQAVLTKDAFTNLLRECHVVDVPAATSALADAGCVLAIDGGAHYHIKPAQWLHDVATISTGSDDAAGPFANLRIVEDAQESVVNAEARHNELLKSLDGAVSKASRWRKTIWGGAMLFSGAQLAIISRLTYVDLDWDIMEPVSYFLGTGTSLVFFLYVLRFKRDHSYEDFDRTFLPARVRKYAPKDFDWNEYEASKENVVKARAHLQYVKEWASVH
ncbi:membrane-associated protein, putative [Bodo saltans]|uniref:Membrane-associated protein, putative n=1 Tax=Bodo saltans TaxID=75058 RepID=A0A0S4JRI1_BODSA|nr:membrane-associated protein, putative [Bodo saltans]|eukprot:CUG94149.1 membrane-associated protein, putative [Bodo saltans]